MPHFSALEGVKIALFVLVILGTARLLAMSYPDNTVSRAFVALY